MIRREENFKEYIELIYRKHKSFIVVVILILLVLVTFLLLTLSAKSYNVEDDVEVVKNNDTFVATEKIEDKKVYISGEVNNPGVYNISNGDRIEDIIRYAGGITEYAVVDYVNLAEIVSDEQHIIIPSEENVEASSTYINNNTSGKININKASEGELTQITGVGEATAKNIILYRESNGKFTTIEDLKKVSGIGDKTFEKLKDQIDIK